MKEEEAGQPKTVRTPHKDVGNKAYLRKYSPLPPPPYPPQGPCENLFLTASSGESYNACQDTHAGGGPHMNVEQLPCLGCELESS